MIPIYKASNPSLFTNYRPISLLSNFSKFIEKVMYNRITEFVEQYNMLYHCQFGFRKSYLTSHALIHLINKVSSAIDQRETLVGVFLDLSKAFDTLDHQILFTKLKHSSRLKFLPLLTKRALSPDSSFSFFSFRFIYSSISNPLTFSRLRSNSSGNYRTTRVNFLTPLWRISLKGFPHSFLVIARRGKSYGLNAASNLHLLSC